MTTTLLIQIISLVIFIVFISAISLQSRAKAILTGIYFLVTAVIYVLLDNGTLAPHVQDSTKAIMLVGLPPLLFVGIGYWMLVRYTLEHRRTPRRK